MEKDERKEFLFYYESRQNPNGDPSFENQPRLMSDGRILVTDVRIKRTIRDYAKKRKGETIFVDFSKDGKALLPRERAKEILGNNNDYVELLKKTFDVPLFGALVPIKKRGGKKKSSENEAEDKEEGKGSSFKITGPVQFSLGRSVNKPEIINPTISSHFVGRKKGKEEEHGSIGKFYSVDYALIKFQGVINPNNLLEYWEDNEVWEAFNEKEDMFFECLWKGTNELDTRSKHPQRSILYIEVTYENSCYNDLNLLVDEDEKMKGEGVTKLVPSAFNFSNFVDAMRKRKSKIKKIRVAACEELSSTVEGLVGKLKGNELKTERIEC